MNHIFVDVSHRYFSISFSFSEGTVFAYKTGFLKSGAVLCSLRIHRIVPGQVTLTHLMSCTFMDLLQVSLYCQHIF